ncbi:MAG: MGMT family protein, partial [Candidatus Thermoplasmatota archaeon]|nr:MGMT family protein [Candidatus Thermoplasmatota archaeon]
KAARAVANACGENPNPITTPCHRVICSNGEIGGYSGVGGIKKKIELLRKEGVDLF